MLQESALEKADDHLLCSKSETDNTSFTLHDYRGTFCPYSEQSNTKTEQKFLRMPVLDVVLAANIPHGFAF